MSPKRTHSGWFDRLRGAGKTSHQPAAAEPVARHQEGRQERDVSPKVPEGENSPTPAFAARDSVGSGVPLPGASLGRNEAGPERSRGQESASDVSAPVGQTTMTSPAPALADQTSRSAQDDAAASKGALDANLDDLVRALGEGAAYLQLFTPQFQPQSIAPDMKHEQFIRFRLAQSESDGPPAGKTGGCTVRLPDFIEKQASGRSIQVRVLARAYGSDEAHLACAYFTNEVGNSGWRPMIFGSDWKVESFSYKVPPMKAGMGDFLGLSPPPEHERAVDVAGFAIEIVETAPQATTSN